MDFENAAEGPLPSDTLPDVFNASLLQSKAWGLVMTNRPQMAEPLFKQASKYLAPLQHSRLYLYLLNISALNKLRLEDIKSALKLEKEIEKNSMPPNILTGISSTSIVSIRPDCIKK